ncbi:hypothetical protein RFI_27469 [Reticulomyxa filosa]|uniref:Tubulin alpha chain n=1 Tax=Reticulomyxa filosa TaxID=46433 RepID=X6M7N2_RETFI|nr:hypothetical protein RFI_27469 [Reticulomyxa filosa]|eukprot:ETO09914.1 hypothetical protein RFI_27469 [Reticulomyxa filosa]
MQSDFLCLESQCKGLGALLQKEMKSAYSKVPQISFAIYPSLLMSTCVVEPYNALLATHGMIDYNDITVVLDNEAGYDLVAQHLLKYSGNPQAKASYYNINSLVCKVVSSMTCGLRFVGEQQIMIADMQTNLVPFPRLHFMTCSLTPIVSESNKEYTPWNEEDITLRAFEKEYMFIKFHDWDVQEDQYCGISLIYRGNANVTAINSAIQKAKHSRLKLVEWCPTGFKTSIIDRGLSALTDDGIMATDKSLTMIGNNTAVTRPFEQRIGRKFDLMYSQRAFVHWYVGEGMEEGEFAEAREDLGLLVKDYTDLKTNRPSDDENSTGDADDTQNQE